MTSQIIWSPVAVQTYQQILDYLEINWTVREVVNFIHRTEEILELSVLILLSVNNPNDQRLAVAL